MWESFKDATAPADRVTLRFATRGCDFLPCTLESSRPNPTQKRRIVVALLNVLLIRFSISCTWSFVRVLVSAGLPGEQHLDGAKCRDKHRDSAVDQRGSKGHNRDFMALSQAPRATGDPNWHALCSA